MTAVFNEDTQFVDTDGKPVVGGLLYFGVSGSDPKLNPISIFSDPELTVALANPQTTNSLGRSTNKIYLSGKYSFRISTSADVQIYQELQNGSTSTVIPLLSLNSVAGSNTITATASTTVTVYTDKQQFIFKTVSINTGAVTLNVDGVGAKAIVKNNTEALENVDFSASQQVIVAYNSSNDNFEWVNQKTGLDRDTSPQLVAALDTNDHIIQWSKGVDIASAATITLGTDGNSFDITGTTTIAAIAAIAEGTYVVLRFDDVLTLTDSSAFELPSNDDIITAAGDVAIFYQKTASNWRCASYMRNDGRPVIGISLSTQVFTASGTWTKPAGVRFVRMKVTGGGVTGTASTSGASGGTAIKTLDVTGIASATITVAAIGGNSIWDDTVNVITGVGAGGTPTNGDINIVGGAAVAVGTDANRSGVASYWGASPAFGSGGKGGAATGTGAVGVVEIEEFL